MATGVPNFAFFFGRLTFSYSYSYCWTGNKNRQQSNAGFLCWSRIYDCVMECLSLLYFLSFPLSILCFGIKLKMVINKEACRFNCCLFLSLSCSVRPYPNTIHLNVSNSEKKAKSARHLKPKAIGKVSATLKLF